jgi:hypothetical protein
MLILVLTGVMVGFFSVGCLAGMAIERGDIDHWTHLFTKCWWRDP